MARTKTIYVHPVRTAKGTIQCHITFHRDPSEPGSANSITLEKNSARCDFEFNIVNTDDTNVKFKDPPVDVGEDCACPPPPGVNTNQIDKIHLHNATQMSFANKNNGRCRNIIYQLNMREGDVDCSLDPEIKNGGGTGNLYSSAMLVGAAVGAILGAVGALTTGMALTSASGLTYVLGGAILGALAGFLLGR